MNERTGSGLGKSSLGLSCPFLSNQASISKHELSIDHQGGFVSIQAFQLGKCSFQLLLGSVFLLDWKSSLAHSRRSPSLKNSNRANELQKYRVSVPKGADIPVSSELSWVKRI